MKKIYFLFLLTLISMQSCKSQTRNDNVSLHYKVQTRGYLYEVQVNNDTLKINNNSTFKTIRLTPTQLIKIDNLLSNIDIKKIKNNVSTKDLAVDKAVKGVFDLNFSGNSYSFNFNHNKLPKEIDLLLKQLERFKN